MCNFTNILYNKIVIETNFKIEGMTTIQLEDKIKKLILKNKNIKSIFERNQLGYITTFFSKFLLKDGKYIKDTHLKDLLILYSIDYYLKEKLTENSLKVNRHLNILILNSWEKGLISKRTGDKQNTFEAVVNFFKEKLSTEEQEILVKEFNKLHDTSFKNSIEFYDSISYIVVLRNSGLYHYSVISYEYATMIEFGVKHKNKDGKTKTLKDTMHHLAKFINVFTAKKLINEIKDIIYKHEYSTPTIGDIVWNKMFNLLNFDILLNINRKNHHYSISNLLEGK